MGREIRKVPPNWDHPRTNHYGDNRYKPLYDRSFKAEAAEWKEAYAAWERGERPDYCDDESKTLEFWEWHGMPPDPEYYRPYADEDRVWFQVYETVSEGTPVTPPFATKAELVDYLATHGDFWDQKRGHGPWSRANAESFVGDGYAPSLVVTNGQVLAPRDGQFQNHQ